MKRIGMAIAAAGLIVTTAFVGAAPASAVHAGQKICNSGNSTGNLIYYPSNVVITKPKPLKHKECRVVKSSEVKEFSLTVEGSKFRVAYDGGAYKAWQSLPYGDKNFRPSNNNLIWIQVNDQALGEYVFKVKLKDCRFTLQGLDAEHIFPGPSTKLSTGPILVDPLDNGTWFVHNGRHRVIRARLRGEDEIDAELIT